MKLTGSLEKSHTLILVRTLSKSCTDEEAGEGMLAGSSQAGWYHRWNFPVVLL